jgi:hypothetical protein
MTGLALFGGRDMRRRAAPAAAAPAVPIDRSVEEMPASHLLPGDRFRRGDRSFVALTVAVSTDRVTVTGDLIVGADLAGSQDLTMEPAEIVRRIRT